MSSRPTRLGLIVLAALLPLASSPEARAQGTYAEPPVVTGSPDAGHAPLLPLGRSRDTLPTSTGRLSRTYRVHRSPGATLTAAARVDGQGPEGAPPEEVTVRLTLPDGTECASGADTWAGGRQQVWAAAGLDAGAGLRVGSDERCRSASDLLVVATRDGSSGAVPLTLTWQVTEEPGATTFAGLPPALEGLAGQDFQAATAGPPAALAASTDADRPSTVGPGTWRMRLPLNRDVHVRVRLVEGQRAAVTVRPVGTPQVAIESHVVSPTGFLIPQDGARTYSPTLEVDPDAPARNTLTALVPEVRYLNRTVHAVQGASAPGLYVVVLRATPSSSDPKDWPGPVDVEASVEVRGAPSGRPSTVAAPTGGPVTATPEPSIQPSSPAITLTASTAEGDAPWTTIGIGALALLTIGVGAWVAARQRRQR